MKIKIVKSEGCISIVTDDKNYYGFYNDNRKLIGEIVDFPENKKHKK